MNTISARGLGLREVTRGGCGDVWPGVVGRGVAGGAGEGDVGRGVALAARGVCFGYSAAEVLHDVTLELPFGAVTAIAGANGSGKSTLVEILAGVLRPRRGQVLRAGPVALVLARPEAPRELPLTAAEVVAIGTWSRAARLRGRAAAAAVADALARVELDDVAAQPFHTLSTGQRQRVLLAQGIVTKPAILLLDEPAAALDPASRERAQGILAEEAERGAAVASVTHEEAAIAVADQVLRLEGGRVAAPAPAC